MTDMSEFAGLKNFYIIMKGTNPESLPYSRVTSAKVSGGLISITFPRVQATTTCGSTSFIRKLETILSELVCATRIDIWTAGEVLVLRIRDSELIKAGILNCLPFIYVVFHLTNMCWQKRGE